MLNFIGTVFLASAIAISFTAILGEIHIRLSHRVALAGAIGGWIGSAISVAAAGALANPLVLLVLFITPLLVTGCAVVVSPALRARLLSIRTSVLIRLNALRLAGVLFLALAATGRLAGPFPELAGWGDILTGVAAVMINASGEQGLVSSRRLVTAWNAFGILDLVLAVALGLASADGSPLQLIHAGAGSTAVVSLPWSLIPTVLVPFFLILHGIVFAQLRAGRGWDIGGFKGIDARAG